MIFENVKKASKTLAALSDDERNAVLRAVADSIIAHEDELLAANADDLSRMEQSNPLYDRLQLTSQRLADIASDMRNVATLPSPLGHITKENTLPNGLRLRRISVPFGVIGMIYEARPNVTFDVFSLCFKSGNACVLKGGKDADSSNRAAVSLIHNVLRQFGISEDVVALLPATHEATAELLNAVGYVDLCIPRGGKRLINFVRDTARVPVIETGAGVVHAYFDRSADLQMGKAIVCNAKTRRVSVCNALDTLIIHSDRLADLPALCEPLAEKMSYELAMEVSDMMVDLFLSHKVDRVELVFNHFKNAGVQVPTREVVLPLKAEAASGGMSFDYIVEPDKETFVNQLIPKVVRTNFYSIMLDTLTAEHGARMTAMHIASDNADQLSQELKIQYNKARQNVITNELIDIVGGAEALNG